MRRCVLLLAVAAAVLAGCGSEPEPPREPTPSLLDRVGADDPAVADVDRKVVEVIEVLPADPTAFTQGLEVTDDGRLFESTGQYGSSDIREVDLDTGEVLRVQPLAASEFGEGLTVVGGRLIVLTWRENTAIVVDPDTFEEIDRFTYEGEGWGLCFDGEQLVMSDGSSELTFRDPDTFGVLDSVRVTLGGRPLVSINELECVDGRVYANIWQTDDIVVIEPASGEVVTVIDASGLLTPAEAAAVDVLNGIAAVPGTDEFLLTGKNWPSMFRVRFVPAS